MLKTGRYVRYSDNQQLGRLHFALLKKFGLNLDAYGRSMDPLSGFDASDFELYRERAFKSWVRVTKDGRITVQGHLRMSDNLDDAKVFFVDVVGRPSVRVEVPLRDFHQFNLAYHCGTGITLSVDGERAVITKVHDLQSIFGKAPGTQAG